MALTVDLNSDMGEGFGPWKMGDDDALLQFSASGAAVGLLGGDIEVLIAEDQRSEGAF